MAAWQTLEVASSRRVEVIDLTPQLAALCRAAARDGVLVAFCAHTTAGLVVNEAEARLLDDLQAWLERLVPQRGSYAHNTVDDNADAHLRAIMLGHSVCVPVEGGRLVLGTWQRILFLELDGPRRRTVRAGVWA
jgi:secondary thiamine-phosphate synthase enzyme